MQAIVREHYMHSKNQGYTPNQLEQLRNGSYYIRKPLKPEHGTEIIYRTTYHAHTYVCM